MTNAEARFNNSLRPRKPEGSLGRTAQDVRLDSHTASELCALQPKEEHIMRKYLYTNQWYVNKQTKHTTTKHTHTQDIHTPQSPGRNEVKRERQV